MDKLKEILKWLSKANEDQIDGLYEVLINEELYCLEDVFYDKEIYKIFMREIKEEALDNIKCCNCGAELGEIYCEDCLGKGD